jgi:hypothetical protein
MLFEPKRKDVRSVIEADAKAVVVKVPSVLDLGELLHGLGAGGTIAVDNGFMFNVRLSASDTDQHAARE